MKSFIITFIVFFVANIILFSQPGMHVYVGPSFATNNSTEFTKDGFYHPGYHAGADFRINSGATYFLGGLQYHETSHEDLASYSYKNYTNKVRWLKGRFGLGYTVFSIKNIFKLRAKTLGSIDMIYPEASINPFGDNRYNGATASGVLGLGIDLGPVTLDAEFHKNFVNAINMIKGTSIDFWIFNVGFFF